MEISQSMPEDHLLGKSLNSLCALALGGTKRCPASSSDSSIPAKSDPPLQLHLDHSSSLAGGVAPISALPTVRLTLRGGAISMTLERVKVTEAARTRMVVMAVSFMVALDGEPVQVLQ